MKIKDITDSQKEAVKRKWLNELFATYHKDVAKFLKREKNQFANPVAHSYAVGLDVIVEEITGAMDSEKICAALTEIIKIRAIQDFTPSEALAFLYTGKGCFRSEIPELMKSGDRSCLDDLDRRLDQVLLFGLDVFVNCRERMYQLRVEELKRSVASIVNRLNRCGVDAELEPGIEETDETGEEQTARC